MSKITRIVHKIFGANATWASQMGKFGSLKNGSPAYAANALDIQSLANFEIGLYGAVIGNNSPAIQDINAAFHHSSRQLGYLFQTGVAEWNVGTIYFIGSVCSSVGEIYVSLTDTNTGNALTDITKWKIYGGGIRTLTATGNALVSDDIARVNNTAAIATITLPAIATVPLGKKITVKRVCTSTYLVTVKGNASENIDGVNTFDLETASDALTIINNGTSWEGV